MRAFEKKGVIVRQQQTELAIKTTGPGLFDFTDDACRWVSNAGIENGILTLFCRHTSASLTIQENADPDVLRDLHSFFQALVREDPLLYRHNSEGPDDMPAHIRAALTDVSLNIPVADGRPVLGTWQGIYLFEHRARPHRRSVFLHLMGD